MHNASSVASDQLARLKRWISTARHRAVVVCSGSVRWGIDCSAQVADAFQVEYGISIGFAVPPAGCVAFTHPHQLLGVDVDAVIWDVRGGLNPDHLALAAGAVRAGGCLVLCTPPLDAWPGFADPDYHRMLIEGYQESQIAGHFLARLARVLATDPHVIVWEQDTQWGLPDWLLRAPPARAEPAGQPTAEQHALIDAVVRVGRGHRLRPLVIKADRGRGKTAGLGMAAARLLQDGGIDIRVTAPRLENVEPLFRHALAAGCNLEQNSASELYAENGSRLSFHAPDALLDADPGHPGKSALLLVDEAAALSPHLLSRFLTRFSRVVFATTVHGYEGSGRGFELRFLPALQKRYRQVTQLTLTQPVRWSTGDCLEAMLNTALLLKPCAVPDATTHVAALAAPGSSRVDTPIEVMMLQQAHLAENDALLTQVFHLLLDAHYRTRPSDLRDLLDGPNLRLWAAVVQGNVVGVLLVAQEGGLPADLDTKVWEGTRRPRGHQLPQTLVGQLGLAGSLRQHYARVVRIAVLPVWRRRGIGSALLDAAEHVGRQAGMHAIGSLFGATPELIYFWRRLGYQPLRLGFTHQVSTGEHSVLMIKDLREGDWLAPQLERFQRSFRLQLATTFRYLSADLALALLDKLPEKDHQRLFGEWAGWMSEELDAFCQGRRYFDACYSAVYQWCLRYLKDSGPDSQDACLLIARVLQQQSRAEMVAQYGLSGQRGVDAAVRRALIQVRALR